MARQPKSPFPQPTDAFADDGTDGFHSSRRNGSPAPPAIPATPVTTRPLLIPDDGTEATPPGPDALSEGSGSTETSSADD